MKNLQILPTCILVSIITKLAIATYAIIIIILYNYTCIGGSRITKRQQQAFTDQDVFVLDTLSENEGVLTVRVVVGGGQEGQSAPVISSNDMAMLLQINGPRLALVLSSVVCSLYALSPLRPLLYT